MLWRLLLSRFIALMLVGLAFSGALSPTAHALTLLETIGYKTISLDLSSHTKTSEGYHRVKKVIDYDRPAPKHVPPPVELRGIPSRTTHVTTIHRDIRRIEQQLLIDCAAQTYAVQDTKHFDKNFGVAFAIWDLMFGSLAFSEKAPHKFGLKTKFGSKQSIIHLYFEPFKVALNSLQRSKKLKRRQERQPYYEQKINEQTS